MSIGYAIENEKKGAMSTGYARENEKNQRDRENRNTKKKKTVPAPTRSRMEEKSLNLAMVQDVAAVPGLA
jgi:hypothetical protein